MDIELELSRRLDTWFASRRKVREWVARHPAIDIEDEQQAQQFYGLRNETYDCEWSLLDLGARQDAWEKALENESDHDRADAMELRQSQPELEPVAARHQAARLGLKFSGWWFIPYAVWVGLPRPSRYPRPPDHAQPMIARIGRAFRDHARATIPARLAAETEMIGRPTPITFQFLPCIDADRLRDFPLPPGAFEDWPEASRSALDFLPDPRSALRAGCVGIYLAAPDYRALAMARDLVREMVEEVAGEQADPDIRMGTLMPRAQALSEAEMMRWDLWAHKTLASPLSPGATQRHVALTVARRDGDPVRVSAVAADLEGTRTLGEPASFVCRLDQPQLLFDALTPFVESGRPDTGWSVHYADEPGA